jgi:hypothetical protein
VQDINVPFGSVRFGSVQFHTVRFRSSVPICTMAIINDENDNRRNESVRGFSLTWNSQTNTSKRTVATANAMASVKDENHQQHSNRRKKARWTKKHNKIAGLPEISTNAHKSIHPSVAKGMTFGSSPSDMGLDVYTSEHGLVHWAEPLGCIFSVVVIPRHKTLERVNSKNTALVVNALNKLQKTERSCKRSGTKTGISTSKACYAIVGNKVHRGGRGFLHDKLSAVDPRASDTLRKFAQRMEHVTTEFIPSCWLAAITKANTLSAWPAVGRSKFVAAMASSVDYSAPAHVDDDYLFSIHQLNVDGCLASNEIVQCFCFPTYGFAIGLRPGDIILFNPHVYHCLSEKTAPYAENDTHVTTFYIKTAHVGKNDNSLPLTEKENYFYDMTFGGTMDS